MLSNIFEIPTNLYPRRRSRSAALTTSGFNWQGPAGGYLSRLLASTNPSALIPVTESRSTSRSGINWSSPVASGLLPQLLSTARQLPEIAENLGETLQGQYSNIMRQALSPEAFQGTLTTLANRGLLNSSIANEALANVASAIARNIANQAYTSALQAEMAKMKVPSLLGELVALGRESTSGALSKSTDPARLLSALARLGERTRSWRESESFDENPLAPYQLMASMLV